MTPLTAAGRTSPAGLPVALAIGAIALLCGMDALIKIVAQRYPVIEIAFMRFACGAIVATLAVAIARPGWPSRETVLANTSRGVLVATTAFLFFYALATLPLAEAVTLSFTAPLFVALLGSVLLKERVNRSILFALAAGFIGMLVIVRGQLGEGFTFRGPILGIAAAALSAVTYALSIIVLRARAQRDPVVTIVFFQNLAPGLMLLPFALWFWAPIAAEDLLIMMGIGTLGTLGHLMLVNAFARAPAAQLAPVEYTALLWASGLGYWLFGDIPTIWTIIGALLIVAGTVVTARAKR